MMSLPPKRFESFGDPKHDSLRHLAWFGALAERRAKVEILKQAARDVELMDSSRQAVADFYQVDVRELRDFIDFQKGRSRLSEIQPVGTRRTYQMYLDHCYDVYNEAQGAKSWVKVMNDEARLWGVEARHVIELWEIDPSFYPSNFRQAK